MEGYRINMDAPHVNIIIDGLIKKGGYCPCKVQKIPENLCPCTEFLTTGVCHCRLWVKIEDKRPLEGDWVVEEM